MDHIARGVASAALTLQSILLQALVHKGVLTPAEALGAIDQSLDAVANSVRNESDRRMAEVAHSCLSDVRDGVAAMSFPVRYPQCGAREKSVRGSD
jgi:hypothetical protein